MNTVPDAGQRQLAQPEVHVWLLFREPTGRIAGWIWNGGL